MGAEEVVETSFGAFLVTRGDLIGETTRAGTLWDGPGFLQVIAKEHGRLGEPGVTILDVGANQGAFSIWLARQGAWRVVAVEPVPQVMQRLKANLDLNREWCADSVIPLEVAGYSFRTVLVAEALDGGNWGGTALRPHTAEQFYVAERAVTAMPLDAYQFLWGTRVSLVKIDAQGCDGEAIYGLKETIAQHHPVIVFEWEETLAKVHGATLPNVLTWLAARGYETHEWPTHPNNYLALPKERSL